MSQEQNKTTQSTSAEIKPKRTAVTVPSSAVPLEMMRKYASQKPLRQQPTK